MLNKDEFIKFLVKAKINTYASVGEGAENVLTDSGKELIFEQDKFKYRDRYFGTNPFIGEEIVFSNNQAIWGMNYYGGLINNKIVAKEVYKFLKQALRNVPTDKPFRGPDILKEAKMKYVNLVNGDISSFNGIEKIFVADKQVYELCYQGGWIN